MFIRYKVKFYDSQQDAPLVIFFFKKVYYSLRDLQKNEVNGCVGKIDLTV